MWKDISFRCFRAGCGAGIGLTLGGPDLDKAPLGLGFEPFLSGHKFHSLNGLLCLRVEAPLLERGLEGQRIASLAEPSTRLDKDGCRIPDKTPSGIYDLNSMEQVLFEIDGMDEEDEQVAPCGQAILAL